jgi:hypothetical protein
MPDNTAVPGTESGENFFERITPEGTEEKAGQDIRVHDGEPFAKQHLRPEEGEPESLTVEDGARKLSERRTRAPDLVRFERDGRRGPQTSEEAVHDLTFSKRLARAEGIARAHPLLTPEMAVQAALSVEKGGPIDAYTLDKADKAHPLSHGDTPEEARDRLAELRRAQNAEKEALRQAEVESLQQPQDALEPQAAPEAQQPEPPPLPPVDSLEPERQRVQQEAATLAALRSMSVQELQLSARAQELDAAATRQYGARIVQAGGFEAFSKADPVAARQVLEAKAAYDQLVGQAQNYGQLRIANEQMLQHARVDEQVRVNMAERAKADSEFEKFVTQADPQWQDASYRASLQKMAATLIEEIAPGSSDAIRRGQVFVTASQQRALYDVARARLGDERIKQTMQIGKQKAQADLPPVLRPGNGTTRGEAAAHDQSAQLNRLPYMSGQDAARAGARLLAERRGRR